VPPPHRSELESVLSQVATEARDYLAHVDERRVRSPRVREALRAFSGPLPDEGQGTHEALRRLMVDGLDAAVNSSGPRCFHFVLGGVTPAALGAEMWAAVLDPIAYAWVSSPLAVHLEVLALAWLRELFGLPAAWTGVMVTGATMANFVGLASARQWWGEQHGVDVSARGLSGLPQVPIFSSGHIHGSATKAIAMLGLGYESVRTLTTGRIGHLDLGALEKALTTTNGPAILVATAGEPNAAHFDPIREMAELAEKHGAWLHVDGAFGLFARVSPRTAALADGVELAHSVGVDGHKWLNVPYDCGFSFVRDRALLDRAFRYTGAYLPDQSTAEPVMGALAPESSRRARSFAVWATLAAYGRAGVRAIVEGHLDLAQHLAQRVDAAPDLERLADVTLNVVCFRYRAPNVDLDDLNRRLGQALLEDGRVYVGTTVYDGKVALRPAIANWRTRREDTDVLVDVVRELGARLAG
jgi:glutamate/tyrosine decarboxylase-like PLP-dependent enzyme